jgi:hypothetical protein
MAYQNAAHGRGAAKIISRICHSERQSMADSHDAFPSYSLKVSSNSVN